MPEAWRATQPAIATALSQTQMRVCQDEQARIVKPNGYELAEIPDLSGG